VGSCSAGLGNGVAFSWWMRRKFEADETYSAASGNSTSANLRRRMSKMNCNWDASVDDYERMLSSTVLYA